MSDLTKQDFAEAHTLIDRYRAKLRKNDGLPGTAEVRLASWATKHVPDMIAELACLREDLDRLELERDLRD